MEGLKIPLIPHDEQGEERKCIRKQKYKDKVKYQLVIPPVDSNVGVYIRSSEDIDLLRRIRDEIIAKNYTREELIRNKHKWKRKVLEPTIEKHIQLKKSGRYNVQNKRSYGMYDTLEEARKIRDKLIENDWNEELVPEVKCKRRNRNGEDRYIFKERGKYVIKKWLRKEDGTLITERYESSIPTLEEARKLRDEWESINWDWDNIDMI